MRRAIWQFGNLFRKSTPKQAGLRRSSRPLRLELLEDRSVPSANPSGMVTGTAFVNGSSFAPAGVSVTLSGTTYQNKPAGATLQTDAQGHFTFADVLPGSYSLSTSSFGSSINGMAITVGYQQSVSVNLPFAPFALSRYYYTTETVGIVAPFPTMSAGSGFADLGGMISPRLLTTMPNINNATEGTTNAIDLDAYFGNQGSPNITLQFNTSAGSFDVQMLDHDAPMTAANFLDYVESGSFDNSIFHRGAAGQFLQGGTFSVGPDSTGSSSLTAIDTPFPSIGTSEFNSTTHPPLPGTLSLALTAANTGSSGFFFNLQTPPTSQHYTVFGQLVDANGNQITSSTAFNKLVGAPLVNQSTTTNNSQLQTLPLNGGPNGASTGTFAANDPSFPADATFAAGASTISNFDVINSVQILTPSNGLKYSVTSTNPALVNATVSGNKLTLANSATLTGAATILVTATDEFGDSTATSFTVTVSAPPTITSATAAPNSASPTTTLTVTPNGANAATTGFTYQWLLKEVTPTAAAGFTHVSSTTQANQTLTLPTGGASGAVLPAGTYQFEALVTPTNATDTGSTVTSSIVNVTSNGAGGYTSP